MKTRIKKIEYSDGRVEYIPQIKKFGYEISPFEQEITKFGLWLYFIPIINLFVFVELLGTFGWQRYNKAWEDEDSARSVLDIALVAYKILIKTKAKVTKKVNYIKHP